MIEFKKLSYKNFLSTGNTPNVIDLNKNKLTLITSDKNGQGKCVHPDTRITIQIDDDEILKKFIEMKNK